MTTPSSAAALLSAHPLIVMMKEIKEFILRALYMFIVSVLPCLGLLSSEWNYSHTLGFAALCLAGFSLPVGLFYLIIKKKKYVLWFFSLYVSQLPLMLIYPYSRESGMGLVLFVILSPILIRASIQSVAVTEKREEPLVSIETLKKHLQIAGEALLIGVVVRIVISTSFVIIEKIS